MKKLFLCAIFAAITAAATASDALKSWDKNADGSLDPAEFKEAVAADASYSKFDKDGNSSLDKDELSAAITSLDAGKKEGKSKKAKKDKKKKDRQQA
ncbi:MAG: hypothetical protein RL095_1649 [Verrucomicrobiota bacterium]|jgi:Ca2+-binding EF-hand superfamily protein